MMTVLKRSLLTPLIAFIIVGILGFFFPLLFNSYIQTMIIYCGINIILAVSLNLVNGFTGQFSIGHAGFMATGAYLSAWMSMTYQTNFLINTICGGLAAAVAGYAVGLPSLRLKGDYLAIVTLGFGEIIRVCLLNINAVGGALGMSGIPANTNFYWTFGWVVICVFTIVRLMKSTHGRAFLAVREDEIAAESMGINTTKYKVHAFVISSFFAGVAGSLFAHYLCYLNPTTFGFMKSIDAVVMVVLGGMGSISGSVIAAIVLTLLPEALRPLQEITRIDFRMVIYSLTLVVLMLTRPKGIFGNKELRDVFAFLRRKFVK